MASVANQWSTILVTTDYVTARILYIPPKTISEELAIKHIFSVDSSFWGSMSVVKILLHDKNAAKLFAEYEFQEDSNGNMMVYLKLSEDKDFELGKKIFERLEQQGPIQPPEIRKSLQKMLDPYGYIKDNSKDSYEEVRKFVSTAYPNVHPSERHGLKKLNEYFIDNIPKEKAEERAVEQLKLQFKLLKGNENEFPEFNKAVEFAKKYGPKIETLISIVQEYKKPGVLMLYADFLIGELHLANGNLDEAEKMFKGVNSSAEFGIGAHPLQKVTVQRLDDIANMRATSQTASLDDEESRVDFSKVEQAFSANLANPNRDPVMTYSNFHLLATGKRPEDTVVDHQQRGIRDVTPETLSFAMMEQMRVMNENMRLMFVQLATFKKENEQLKLEVQKLTGQSPAQQPTGSPEPLILSKEPNKERKKDQETSAKPEAGKPERKKPD